MANTKKNSGKGPLCEITVCGIPLVEVPEQKFLVGKTPVTRGQWAQVMGVKAPKSGECDLPCQMSAADCWRFVEKLNASPDAVKLGITFAIPSYEDWKFAGTGGGKDDKPICDRGWFMQNSDGVPHPVAQKLANGYGLYDFAGNVWELCTDGQGHGGDARTDPFRYGAGFNGLSLYSDGGGVYCHEAFGFRVFGYRKLAEPWWKHIAKDLWLSILWGCPEAVDKCDSLTLDGYEWAELLSNQPRLAERCDWQALNEYDWAHLLSEQPQLAENCPWSIFSSDSAWVDLLSTQPQFADKCDELAKMDIGWFVLLIKEQPQFASKFDRWSEISSDDWSCLLSAQPQFAERCDMWSKMTADSWVKLLSAQPRFADKCDKWAKIAAKSWGGLLMVQPQFADRCDKWSKMSADSWVKLLIAQPRFADKCDKWAKVKVDDWVDVLCEQPQLFDKCDKLSRFNDAQWACIIKAQPQLAEKRVMLQSRG